MPVVATPVSSTGALAYQITLDDIRGVMLDFPQYNILLDDVQFTPDEIERAVRLAVDRFNAMPPRTGLTVTGFPNRYLLVMASISLLSLGEACRQARNQVTYQAGDVAPVGIDDKFALWTQLKQWAHAESERAFQRWKLQDNLEACFGGLGSGYRYTNTYGSFNSGSPGIY